MHFILNSNDDLFECLYLALLTERYSHTYFQSNSDTCHRQYFVSAVIKCKKFEKCCCQLGSLMAQEHVDGGLLVFIRYITVRIFCMVKCSPTISVDLV